MYLFKVLLIVFFSVFLQSCNKNLSEDEKERLWSNAQTTGQIYKRSGSKMPNATDEQKQKALRDAETRLVTGGGLFGSDGIDMFGIINNGGQNEGVGTASVGMPINPFLWRASLETIDFMPLSSTDPFAGTIITDWYTSEQNLQERCKLNIFITGLDLKTQNLKVLSFCQSLKNNQWINKETDQNNNLKLENAILNKAKKLKLSAG